MNGAGRVIGRNLPGQFMATRVRVVAAELSTPERVARGREYASTGAVVALDVRPGCVTSTVQGSRREPYEVTLLVDGGDGPPRRDDLEARCSCPDEADAGWVLCKHAVATLMVLAGQIASDPDTLTRWRGSPTSGGTHEGAAISAATVPSDDTVRRSHGAVERALSAPEHPTMPEIPTLHHSSMPRLDDVLGALLDGAYRVLRNEFKTEPEREDSHH